MKIIQSKDDNEIYFLMDTKGLCLKGVYRAFFDNEPDKWEVDLVDLTTGDELDRYFEEADKPMTDELNQEILNRAVDSFEPIINKYMKDTKQELVTDGNPARYVYIYSKKPNAEGKFEVKTFDCVTNQEVPEEYVTFDTYEEMIKTVKSSEEDGYINTELSNVIVSAPSMETFKKWEEYKKLDDSNQPKDEDKKARYLFPELTAEDIEVGVFQYNLIFKVQRDGDDINMLATGKLSDIKKYASDYLDYQLNEDYLEY